LTTIGWMHLTQEMRMKEV
jgi:formyltetrahydrofolate hydrolase